jgi:hypothetical protein
MDATVAAYLKLPRTRNGDVLKWLGYCNQMEKQLEKFNCRLCSQYEELRQSTSELGRQTKRLLEDMKTFVALVRDVVSHMPGQEMFGFENGFDQDTGCSCYERLKGELDGMVKNILDFLEAYPRANDIVASQDPIYEETEYRSFSVERLAHNVQETYKNVDEHILFISQTVRQCWQGHQYLGQYAAYRWRGCGRCIVDAKKQH